MRTLLGLGCIVGFSLGCVSVHAQTKSKAMVQVNGSVTDSITGKPVYEATVEHYDIHGKRWDDELPGVRRCHVSDPFGNRIELIQA